MRKRLFDLVAASAALLLLLPLMGVVALGIKLSDRGPVLYRAPRMGRDGKPFTMFKFRTMRVHGSGSVITAAQDSRIFPLGQLLRKLKVDELPQLFNVLLGQMSIVGPRPEAIDIVRDHYRAVHMETLGVRPGLASPGSIYNYTHGEQMIGQDHPERDYLEKLLPVKLGLELVYVRRCSLRYDFAIIARTLAVIARIAMGQRYFPPPPEYDEACRKHLYPSR
jgi:lipopolysaccharide/colanic/teichoic acid biosynthesis glycosyltransferase